MTPLEKQEIMSEISQILDNYINNPPISKSVEMLTINECCELVTGLSKHTIRELVWQGKLNSIRAGAGKNGKILVSKTSLLAYLENKQGEDEI